MNNAAKYPLGQRNAIFIAKPDAVRRNLCDLIKYELKDAGFYILAEKEKILTPDEVRKIYLDSFRRDYPNGEYDERANKHILFSMSGPVRAYFVEHKEISKPALFDKCMKIRGEHWLPVHCNEDSIRFKFKNIAFDKYVPKFSEDRHLVSDVPENVIHCTLTNEEIQRTFSVFFADLPKLRKYSRTLPAIVKQKNNGSLDMLFVVTYNNSSSEKMSIKMHSGVSHLIAYLQDKGFNVGLMAFADKTPQQISDEISTVDSKVIGFSTVASEFSQIAEISECLHDKLPSTMLLGGGIHFSLSPQDIYATSLDAVNIGEGELPLEELLNGEDIKNISGMAYRGENGLRINHPRPWLNNIDALPSADHASWDKFKEQKNYTHRRIVISRGCPHACTYCSNTELSKITTGNFVRFRSPDSIEKEIQIILQNYPHVTTIFLDSECIIPKFIDTNGLFNMTNKYKNRVEFGTNLRLGSFDEGFIEGLKKNGFSFACVGLESGSERLRKEVLNRNYTTKQILHIFDIAKQTGLKLNTYNLIGLPTETPEDFQKTIDLNLTCSPNSAQLAIFQPYPGTPLFYTSLESGILDNPFYHHFFSGKERHVTVLKQDQFPEEKVYEMYGKFRSIFG